MTILIVMMPESPEAPLLWGLFDKGVERARHLGRQAAGQAFNFSADETPDQTWVVVPGAHILARTVTVPAQSESHLRKAAAFMIEDDLAVDSAGMHIALAPESAAPERVVAAVAHATMRAWAARLLDLNLKANILVPEFLAVRAAPSEATIVDRGDLVTLRRDETGFTIESSALELLVEGALKNVRAIRLVSSAPARLLAGPLTSLRDCVRSEPLSDAAMLDETFAVLSAGAPLNLLQGTYAPRRNWPAVGQEWRRAAILAAAALLLGLCLAIVDTVRLTRHAETAAARAEAVFRQAVPDVKRVVNPRAQIRAALQELKSRSSTGLLRTSDMIFGVVSEIDGVEIQSLRFDAKRGDMAVTLSLPTYDVIERVKTGVKQRGGAVQEGGARQDGDRIVADITVRVP